MELNLIDIRILTYLKNASEQPTKTSEIFHKFGKESRIALEKLYKQNCVDCEAVSDRVQLFLPSYDNWTITDKGCYFLVNNKLEIKLTSKQRLFNYFLGFGSGLLSGCIIQLFIRLLQAG